MKTRYKVPIIITCAFFAIWPMIPNIYWVACEVSSDCSNENPNLSGINFFGNPIHTNVFDVIPIEPSGYLMLGVSFFSMGMIVFIGVRK